VSRRIYLVVLVSFEVLSNLQDTAQDFVPPNSRDIQLGTLKTAERIPSDMNCAKCGKEIPAGQEVKKGFLTKKSYHKECAG
jgi:hypothetical protein